MFKTAMSLFFKALCIALLMFSASCTRKEKAELVSVCGFDEVFIADISGEVPVKLWSWTASQDKQLPPAMRNKFQTTDECKTTGKGKEMLVTSSGGGVALIDIKEKRSIFHAAVPNAHSAEVIAGDYIAVAASFSVLGNRINIYDRNINGKLIASDSLYGAHGLVWDRQTRTLWALGTHELRAYKIKKGTIDDFSADEVFMLPDEDGHDLVKGPDNQNLILSTGNAVWEFNKNSKTFIKNSLIGEEENVKSVSLAKNKEMIYVKANNESWWAWYIRFAGSNKVVYFPGEKIYKARWIDHN